MPSVSSVVKGVAMLTIHDLELLRYVRTHPGEIEFAIARAERLLARGGLKAIHSCERGRELAGPLVRALLNLATTDDADDFRRIQDF